MHVLGVSWILIVLNRSLKILTGRMPILKNATMFIDDDWAIYYSYMEDWFSTLYSPIDIVYDTNQTNDTTLKQKLKQASGLYYQAIHSAPTYLAVKTNNTYETVTSYQIKESNFDGGQLSILFSCSAADYTTKYYLAEAYLYGNMTLAVISSTKVGGFWYGNYLTEALTNNMSYGESFLYWYKNVISNYLESNTPDYNPPWWLGMTIIGDPLISMNITKITPTDTDNDGIYDTVEEMYGTNPTSSDTDNDGIRGPPRNTLRPRPNNKRRKPRQRQRRYNQ